MSDEVWWILRGVAYYQYSDRAVAEAERDGGMMFNYDRVFSTDEWAALGGEELTKGSIIPIRPLRIERVEVKK
jgi:hypothetical protein